MPKPTELENKKAFGIQAVKYQLEYGEAGEDIVRMITQYIAEGWMNFSQGMLMMKAIFEIGKTDD